VTTTLDTDVVEQYERNGCTITIRWDTPLDPRVENHHDSHFYADHNRYVLGDAKRHDGIHPDVSECTSWADVAHVLYKDHGARVILPVFMYDHSGLAVNTTGFSCPWDSGQVGFIFQTAEQIREQFLVKRVTAKVEERARQGLVAEVAEYNSYLAGECYGFTVERDGEGVDSCWGILGDIEHAKAEANAAADAEGDQ
jgi:hypothetical protein